jgi:hypothetical protein
MRADLERHLVHLRYHVGDECFDALMCNLRAELTLWLRAATSRLPEAKQLQIEVVVKQALEAVGLGGRYEVQ